ncbi:hypothetical protein [Stenotrophomonas sp.]|uniref:hypothetical protein n=1 Tax=Stenotrophomonas sp. TaxID=69392 RepID=UPI0028A90535|nr:hypothetical protein [Stenotrophomonas sp.]
MERAVKDLTLANVAGWGSVLVTFGLVQGALYLKAYWGHFGLDPFQFVAVSELALAGLVAIGFVLLLMTMALLLGGWIEPKVAGEGSKSRLRVWLVPLLFFAGLGVLIWWTNAWPLIVGFVLTIVCALTVQLSPIVPKAAKESPLMIYFMVIVVYVSIASNWLGSERAQTIKTGGSRFTANLATEQEKYPDTSLIGRLGDSYVLWEPTRQATILIAVGDTRSLQLARREATRASTD